MHTAIRQDILDFAIQTVTLLRPIAVAVGRQDKDLLGQLKRSSNSFSLNLAEGFGTQRGNERVRFETALGSVYETRNNVRLAIAWGYVSPADAEAVLCALDRLGGAGVWTDPLIEAGAPPACGAPVVRSSRRQGERPSP